MSLVRKLETAIQTYQPDVESLFGVKLGKIKLEPISFEHLRKWHVAHRNIRNANQLYDNTLKEYISLSKKFIKHHTTSIAFVERDEKEQRIYYSRNPLMHLLPYFLVEHTGIHEMAHLAHRTISGLLCFYPKKYIEGLANYAADEILIKRGEMPFFPENHAGYARLIGSKSIREFNYSVFERIVSTL